MADSKLSALATITTAADADLIYITDDPGGTPISKGITVANFVDNYITSATKAELDILDGATLSTTEINYLDGTIPGTAVASKALALGATKNIDTIDITKDGLKIGTVAVTTTSAELNILDGATLSTAELNYVTGVTSAIQTQLDAKAPLASPALTGTPTTTTGTTGAGGTQIASQQYVDNTAFSSALPNQSGNGGKFLTTDGTSASWAAAMPVGGIIMWSGAISAIPTGWAICDGTSGTPDLTGRFVIHADADSGGSYDVGDTGDGTIPAHLHASGSLANAADSGHTHNIRLEGSTGGSINTLESTGDLLSSGLFGAYTDTAITQTGGSHNHTISGNTGNTGTGTEVIAKHYALAYIMKT